MRRILLGGLGIALGVFAPPALAQQPRTNGAPPARAASLGRPSAIPDPQPDPEITQTGLLRNGPTRGTVTYAPGTFGTPTPATAYPPVTGTPVAVAPVYGAPAVGAPIYGAPAVGAPIYGAPPMVQPTPPSTLGGPPRASTGGPPSVTESRGDPTGRIPDGTFVPSVVPDGGAGCPVEVEDPLYTGPTFAGTDRVARIGKGWVSAELLMWWSRGNTVPPLVTTSSTPALGILGPGDTRVLLGGSFGESFHTGGRVGAGYWFGDTECRGVDARLFWVSPTTASFGVSTAQDPLLARPFVNVNPTTAPTVGFGQSSEIVARPGVATGSVVATLKSTVWGAELNYRRYLYSNGAGLRFDLLAGYRYLDLREQLTVTERFVRTTDSDPNIGVPALFGTVTDSFRTTNRFHGGQVGIAGTYQRGRWSIDPRATIAFGTVHQTAEINGGQSLTFANGVTATTAGGLLAVPGANIGRFSQDKFAVVPEVGLNVGWQATDRLKLFVGYNFLYLSSALRPGDAIDPRLDAARVPNLLPAGAGVPISPVRPMPQFNTSGYFIQGISFGVAYRW